MKKEEYIPQPLTPTLGPQAVAAAKKEIVQEQSGVQLGLKVRWEGLNIANRKYFRLKQIYLFAGLSGHAKSYILNLITNDFLDRDEINKDFKDDLLILNFTYEMTAQDELLRTLGTKMNMSYGKILSSEWDSETKSYKGMSKEETKQAFSLLDDIGKRPVFYFETAGNLKQLEATVAFYVKAYAGQNKKLIVTIDHTLLSEKLNERSELELMANTGKTALRLKKQFGAMVIMLGQLNNAIEDYKRINNARAHYPIKSDIYAAGQIYNACDTVITIHQPFMLKIPNYGVSKYPTKNLIHLQVLKARHGRIGSVWLENRLDIGKVFEKDFSKKDDVPL